MGTNRIPSLFAGHLVLGVFLLLALPASASAANRYWVGPDGGNTNDSANWASADPASCTGGGASVPGTSDIAIFDADCDNSATINATFSVAGIQMNSGYAGTVTQANGIILTVGSSAFTLNGGTFVGGNDTIRINGSFTMGGGSFTNTSSGMLLSGNFTKTAGTYADSGTMTFTGNSQTVSANGTLGGTVVVNQIFNGNGGFTVAAGTTINLGSNPFSYGGWGGATPFVNDGTLLIPSGTWNLTTNPTPGYPGKFSALINNGTIMHGGTGWVLGTTQFINRPTGLITYAGTSLTAGSDFTQSGSFALAGKTITLNGNSQTVTANGALGGTVVIDQRFSANGGVTISAGTSIDLGANPTSYGGYNAVNGLVNNGTITIASGTWTVGTSPTPGYPGRLASITNNGTIIHNGSAWTVGSSIPVTNSAGGTINLSGSTLSVASTFTNNGTLKLTGDQATVTTPTLNAGSTVIYTAISGTRAIKNWSYRNLTIYGTGGTFTLPANTTVTQKLTVSGGTLSLSGKNLTVSGTVENRDTVALQGSEAVSWANDTDSGTVRYAGTGSYASLAAGSSYYNLAMSGSGVWNLGAALDVNGALGIQTGATLDLAGQNLDLTGGSFSNAGTLRLQGGEALTNFTNAASGTVEYDGGGTYASLAAGNTYHNLLFSGAGSWTPGSAADVNGTFTLASGTFNQGASALNIAGDVRIAAGSAFTKASDGTSRLVLDGDLTLEDETAANLGILQVGTSPDTVTLSGSIVADRLLVSAGDVLVTDGFDVTIGAGGLTNSGTITASAGNGGTTRVATSSGVINWGTYTAGNSTLALSGSLVNRGTFTPGTSTVTLNGSNQALSGSTTFNVLSKVVAGADTLTFARGQTFTGASLILRGAPGNLLSLRSSTNGVRYGLKLVSGGSQTVDHVNVRDADSSGGEQIHCSQVSEGCVNAGNVLNWLFYFAGEEPQEGGGGGGAWLLDLRRRNGLDARGNPVAPPSSGGGGTAVTAPEADTTNAATGATLPGVTEQLPGDTGPQESGVTLPDMSDRLAVLIDGRRVVFRDVPLAAWFAPFVADLVNAGIVSGYRDEAGHPTGLFGPADPVTHAQVAKVALLAAGNDIDPDAVPANLTARDTWAAPFVAAAEALSLSVYRADLPVHGPAPRGAVVQTMLQAFGIPLDDSGESPYRDLPPSHPHAAALLTAARLGIITGDTDRAGNPAGTVRPDDPVNRAEAAKIIVLARDAARGHDRTSLRPDPAPAHGEDAAAPEDGRQRARAASTANLRGDSRTTAAVREVLSPGTEVTILRVIDGIWVEVQTASGRRGFVAARLLE